MYNKRKDNKNVSQTFTPSASERGAVSIFIVIFFSLLVSVITLSYIGIVIRGANQSTNDDLSRSAYDSAEAGVEDAKRAIALETNQCNNGGTGCGTYTADLARQDCTALPSMASALGLTTGSGNDIKVQSTSDTNALDQAYSCVNVTMNTPDYINSDAAYSSDVIPLKTVAGATTSGITLNWFTHTDAGLADGATFALRPNCSVSPTVSSCDLPTQTAWDTTTAHSTPALLRVQLISFANASGNITESDLANTTKTLFLYPSASGATNLSFAQNKTPANAADGAPLFTAKCSTGATATYACSVNIALGMNVGTAAGQRTAFLRVTPMYKKSTFQVQLTGANTPLFDGVQPIVDSTGRANDLFRRVQARVRLENQILYPEFAIDENNSFCKYFEVGAATSDFVPGCS